MSTPASRAARAPAAIVSPWATREGSPTPLGATWIAAEQAYNFALYSKYATRVTLLLYGPGDLVNPVRTYDFHYLENKTGRVWHLRIPKAQMQGAKYYAYSIDGPPPSGDRFERHAFNPQKILLDPYARSIFFPRGSTERRRWAPPATRARHHWASYPAKNQP